MKSVVTVQEAVTGISLAYLPITAANSLFRDVCDQVPLRLHRMQDQKSLRLIFKMGQGACHILFYLYRRPILWYCITMTKSHFKYLTYKTQNHWRSIDPHFATGVSAIFNHFIWYNMHFMEFWHLFYRLHVLSPLSLHCSLIIHINISFKIYFKVSTNCG